MAVGMEVEGRGIIAHPRMTCFEVSCTSPAKINSSKSMKTYAFCVKKQARAAQWQKISMRGGAKADLVEVEDEIEFANVAEVPVAQNYS